MVLGLRTSRLILREWPEDDLEPSIALSMDPEVMRHLARPRGRAEVERWVAGARAHFRDHGFAFGRSRSPGVADLAGFAGLTTVPYEAHFTPAVGRLARAYWGNGYASEAAKAALDLAFFDLGLAEVVANAAIANKASIRVMERIGMSRDRAMISTIR